MHGSRWNWMSWVAIGLTSIVGCGDSERFRTLQERDGRAALLDGGIDAGRSRDAGREGGMIIASDMSHPFDGGYGFLDGAIWLPDGEPLALDLPDGAVVALDGAIVLPDGQVIDLDAATERYSDQPEIDVKTCGVGELDSWEHAVDFDDEGSFSLAAGNTGFGVAFQGASASCAGTVDVVHMPSAGALPPPQSVIDACKATTDVAIVGEGEGWRLAWVDNRTGSAELHTTAIDEKLEPVDGDLVQVTDNAARVEQKPVLASIDGAPLLAWIERAGSPAAYSIHTHHADGDESVPIIEEADGHEPQRLAMAQTAAESAAVIWVGPKGNVGAWFQKLDLGGAPLGQPEQLTSAVGAASAIDIATRISGGDYDGAGIVYSIVIDGMPQVRFRRVDAHGDLTGTERRVVLAAQGAGIAHIGGGYAVTYLDLSGSTPEVRLTFVTKEGNLVTDSFGRLISFSIAETSLTSARTEVSVSNEGQLMVAWIDAAKDGNRNRLRVVRRRLNCN